MSEDLKDTVFLPKTGFAMKANLPNREPAIQARWEEMGLYKRLREISKGREKFILHDGPPYANGHLHMGHAVNKILKDVINKNHQMLGFDAPYVPGWDCHGLPIEWNIETQYRKKGKNKDDVPVTDFRKECRDYASKWIDIQRSEFKRLGVIGDWDNPYSTMSFETEAGIFHELRRFLENGSLYRGKKSVMWSVVEKTALAEAEVEYKDHTSTTIFVAFPITKAPSDVLEGASVVIWTTTPWTIPANQAVAYGKDIRYAVVEMGSKKLVVAKELAARLAEAAGGIDYSIEAEFSGEDLAGAVAAHPLRGLADGYTHDIPLLPADFVSDEDGTGLVHIAPSHGADDFELGERYGLAVPETVAEDGIYTQAVPGFEGIHVFKAAQPVIDELINHNALVAQGSLVHSYPHSWRSGAPLIFRATAQWFVAMDGDGNLRDKALEGINNTMFVPKRGQKRLYSMVAERPDWCLSRQRAWGVPIALFVNKNSGEVLNDPVVHDRIFNAFKSEGADAWWKYDAAWFLGNAYDARDYEKVDDILDVWFDSGCTHANVIEKREELSWPASLYLEGSDQHRGWFHSSLLESCGTRGRPPYNAVLTHGFCVDAKGEKMSKSKGNGVDPLQIMKTLGADILRLWVMTSDYSEDLRIGDQILKGQTDSYRRLRNTLRYTLANLRDFHEQEKISYDEMPELERWVLHRIYELDQELQAANDRLEYQQFYISLLNFCTVDLSAFYFDIRKDALYCDLPESAKRRAARTVLDITFHTLVTWLAPVLSFTCEEAWQSRYPDDNHSVHLELFARAKEEWKDVELAQRWEQVRKVRKVVTGALEIERKEKRIGSSLQSAPAVYISADYTKALEGLNLAELTITSEIKLIVDKAPENAFKLTDVEGVGVVHEDAEGDKCVRCWKFLEDVEGRTGLCRRCADAVTVLKAA